MDSRSLGKISHQVEPSVRLAFCLSNQLLSSLIQLQTVFSVWESSHRLLTEDADSAGHLTNVVNITAHTPSTGHSLTVVNYSYSRKRAGESFATPARAKQKPVHCSGLIARKTSGMNADMDFHAVLPPEYRAGGDSKRQDQCQMLLTFTITTIGVSISGRLVAAKHFSSEKKVHPHPNAHEEKYILKFNNDFAADFKPQIEEEHEFNSQVPNSLTAHFGQYLTDLQDSPRLLLSFILAY